MTFLIGLQGKKGVGKTTTAIQLRCELWDRGIMSPIVASFAEPVYDIVSSLTNEALHQIKKNKNIPYDSSFPVVFSGMTRRELLQKIGTEVFRDSFDSEIWVSIAIARHGITDYDIVIFDDNRFQNEVDQMNLTIRLERELLSDGIGDNHSSENQQITCDAVFDLDKNSIDELTEIILDKYAGYLSE